MANGEKWDLFDSEYRHRGVFTAGVGQAIPYGLYHKTVEIIPTDMAGNMLLTRRSLQKSMGAGLLEFPAGSVLAGETEETAALRELREETGLQPSKIYFLQRVRQRGVIRYTYLAYVPDLMIRKIQCPPEEVMDYLFVTYEKWMDLMTSGLYNEFRTRFYTTKFFQTVEKLVKKYENETLEEIQPKKHAPLVATNTLATKHKNESHYEDDPNMLPNLPEWEPGIEQGDDGT